MFAYHPSAELKYARYKFVVQVVMGENKAQGVRVASRCLWNPETDNYATYNFKNVCSRDGVREASRSC